MRFAIREGGHTVGGRRCDGGYLRNMAERITIMSGSVRTGKNKNYHYSRGKRKDYKVEVKKFCRACSKHTVHKETKSS